MHLLEIVTFLLPLSEWRIVRFTHTFVTISLFFCMFSPKHVGNNYLPPFIKYFFATSLFQDNSSEFSPIMPDDFGEHLTRDQRPFLHTESLQIFQIHRSMLFSSSTLIFYRVQVRDWDGHCRCLVLCSVLILRITVLLDDPNMAHYKVSSRGCQV